MNNKIKGLLFTFVLSFVVIFLFFGNILKDPDNFYFSAGGDGFKAYYGAIYHLEHDTTTMRMNGMNYPYGEMVFFTGSQPVVVNTVKFISNNITDISNHIVGIMNLMMIFSILIAAIFIFLIFSEFNLKWWYASVAAIGICMLSPQIARFGGHFSLSYLFWIPLMIYLIIRFDKKPGFIVSVLIGVVTFLASVMQLYFAGFFGFIIGLYWFSRLFGKKREHISFLSGAFHFFIQYILPVVAIQLLIGMNDNVTDRTNYPYGFFAFMGHPFAVFFPSGRPYSFVPQVLAVFKHISWEELSFVGVAATGGFITGTVFFLKKLFAGKKFYRITGFTILNVLFWSSFAALLFSFGVPFVFGLEGLADYIGPLKQLRALGRFSWLFFYMLNIVLFVNLYHKSVNEKGKPVWKVITVVALFFLLFDGVWNIYTNSRNLQNRRPVLEDKENTTPVNEWANEINPEDYQAIIPIPFFHVGSENIWVESKHSTQELTMMASLKTGLPTTAVQLSRTSIGQTYKNLAITTDPLEKFQLLDDLPNQKPFLLLFNRDHYPDDNEIRLLNASKLIYQNDKIELRRLPVEKLKNLHSKHATKVLEHFNKEKLFERNGFLTNDSASFFIYRNYDEFETGVSFAGKGAMKYSAVKWAALVEDTLKNVTAGNKYVAGFWMYNYKKDGFLRAHLEIIQKELSTDKTTNYIYTDVHRHIKALYGKWALIEIEFETKSESERFKISVRNTILKDNEFILDELLVREKGVNLYRIKGRNLFKNGRKIPFNESSYSHH